AERPQHAEHLERLDLHRHRTRAARGGDARHLRGPAPGPLGPLIHHEAISMTAASAAAVGFSGLRPTAFPPRTLTATSASVRSASVCGSPVWSERAPITGGPTMKPV